MRAFNLAVGAVLASGLLLWFYVTYRQVDTIIWLRRHSSFDDPLLHPLLFFPMLGFLLAAWLQLKNRLAAAFLIAVPSLLLTVIFYLSQAVGGAGP